MASHTGLSGTQSCRRDRSLELRDRSLGSAILGRVIAALAVAAALVAAVRLIYVRRIEQRERRRFALGPDGIIPGAASIARVRRESVGVLLLHGGGDTPQVLDELAEFLYARGFSV